MTLDIFAAIACRKVCGSLWLWKKPESLGELFLSYSVVTL